jgi:hypothetical protein
MLVCVSSHNFAHETAGAARTRHSLLPSFLKGQIFGKTSGKSCRENADTYPLFEMCIRTPRHGEELLRRSYPAGKGAQRRP